MLTQYKISLLVLLLILSHINLRTKPYISHQSYRVLNNNPCGTLQLRVCAAVEY